MRRSCLAALVLVWMLSACSANVHLPLIRARPSASATPASLARFYAQRLAWQDCSGGFECAKLTVPLDYGHPAGDTIAIAVIRRPVADRSHRAGSLLVNPGGPG